MTMRAAESQERLLNASNEDFENTEGSTHSNGDNRLIINSIVEDETDDPTHTRQPKTCCERFKTIVTVEPVLFLYFLAFSSTIPSTQQYVHQYFSRACNLTGPQSHHNACSTNASHDPVEEKVQEETSQYMMYLNVANFVPSIFTLLFAGAYTDKAGRKTVLLMPMVAGILKSLVFVIVIQLQLSVHYLLIGNIIDGLSGGATTVVTACFAYVADITSERQRSIRIFALELGISFGIALSQIYTGYMIESLGYVYPFLLTEFIYAIDMFFIIVYIKDSISPDSNAKFIDLDHLKKTIGLFVKDTTLKRRWKLQLLIIIVLLNYMVDIGSGDVYTIYTLAPPFCFSPILVGYFSAAQYCLRVIGSMVFLKIFQNFLSDVVMMMFGSTSGIAAQAVMAIAMTKVLIFISPVVGILTSLVVPLVRSVCSKLVSPDEQGAISASISLAQQTAFLLGSLVFNNVYTQTVSIYRGIVFIVTGSVYGISLLLMIFLFTRDRRMNSA